ncbi:XRE family transcriptional regulator [Candidatus Liberibacter solanacearum]|uniref:XRE family transcriptional regulator n=1 Tax=Candidatus Liberibacter solanacearum TaxID=556287 RepID=A0A424FKW8_9HYPH|nr:helix-turn-helix transcriptional regulator [Candidatus Liberibacter solanacearum]RPD36769.1 XRE family transcriptional regulator [Candidatus Liberibacter solanacearum]
MEKELENGLNWKEIGQRFRDLRKRNGYERSDIMKKTDDQGGAVYKYESGVQPASINYALFLRNEFGASFDWLYDGVEVKIKSSDRLKKRIINPIEIGERIKKIRKEEGMTLKEFGEWIGISYVAVSNIENGHRTPEIKTALKIKKALNKPLDWIYFGDKCIGTKARITQPTTTKPTMPLKQLKKELKEEAMSYIKVMNESELAMLTTRLRMEQKHHATLSTSTTQNSQLNSTQLNSRSHQKKQKSSK